MLQLQGALLHHFGDRTTAALKSIFVIIFQLQEALNVHQLFHTRYVCPAHKYIGHILTQHEDGHCRELHPFIPIVD